MTQQLMQLLHDIEVLSIESNSLTDEYSQNSNTITPDTGALLSVLVNSINAKNILEIGTANGYSTLWLAYAASKVNGNVKTIESSYQQFTLANGNFLKSDLRGLVHQIYGDAGSMLKKYFDNEMDFIFLNSKSAQYISWWPDIKRILRAGGLLVISNAITPSIELGLFMEKIRREKEFFSCLLPLGSGEFLASKF